MLSSLYVKNESLLDIVSLYVIPVFKDFLYRLLIIFCELSFITIVECRLTQVSLINTVILPTVNETFQKWVPAFIVLKQVRKPQTLTKSCQICQVCVFVLNYWQIVSFMKLNMHLIEFINFGQQLLTSHTLSQIDKKLKVISSDRVETYCDDPYNSFHVIFVINPQESAEYRGSKGVKYKHQGFVCPVLQFLVQTFSLLLHCSQRQSFL